MKKSNESDKAIPQNKAEELLDITLLSVSTNRLFNPSKYQLLNLSTRQ